MLQRTLDVIPAVTCSSAYGGLAEIVQALLINGCPAVDVASAHPRDHGDAHEVFDRVRRILVQAKLLDDELPITERASGVRRFRLASPYQISSDLPARLRITETVEPAAALLHAFVVLRVRYQTSGTPSPAIRIEASLRDSVSLDTLYLLGDAFTERYPVTAELVEKTGFVVLTLRGESQRISGGLNWARGDYIRSRDASLLVRPLREAIEGAMRPLAIPREVMGDLGTIRARVPELVRSQTAKLHWIGSLKDLEDPSGGQPPSASGSLGEHFSIESRNGGWLTATGPRGTDVILPIRSIPISATETPSFPADELQISMEPLGGGREIGANSYYYTFGHRGLLIDAGFDTNRDGWLGLPALQRIARLDAIILTHAHFDHVGALPVVMAAFPRVPIYCTRATLAVLFPQLSDSAKVGQIRFEETGEIPSFNRPMAENLPSDRFRILRYGERVEVPEIPGLSIQFTDAGHIIGSAGAYLEFQGVSLLHTGDISVEDQYLLRGMRTDERNADHVVVEGTYCGEPNFSRAERRAATATFLDAIAERLDAGGSLLIPAFSLGRAQELVGLLVDWMDRTKRTAPIYTVGLVNALNDVSAAHPEFLPGMSGNPFSRVSKFPTTNKRMTDDERRDDYGRAFFEVANKAPSIVIASHGMMVQKTGSYYIGRAILTGKDHRHAICLCGYMDPRTPGFRLRTQREASVIDYGIGDPVERSIPAERIGFFRLTAHASYEELMEVAMRIPTKSIAFIHGDAEGLDKMRADLVGRYAAQGRNLPVLVPAIGERVVFDHAPYPTNWGDDESKALESDSLGPGRKFLKQPGLSVSGLTEDKQWALIKIGHSAAVQALEHDRINADRIDRIDLQPNRGPAVTAYARERGIGSLARIQWSHPGEVRWSIWCRDPNGTLVPVGFRISYGAEMRAVTSALEAGKGLLDIEIGGAQTPEFVALTTGAHGTALDVASAEWIADARTLRVALSKCNEVATLEDVHLAVRWPNGFIQRGPSLGTLTIEPVVSLAVKPIEVGTVATISMQAVPPPTDVRVRNQLASLTHEGIEVAGKTPGSHSLMLEFRSADGSREWREVATVYVSPAAKLNLPRNVTSGSAIEIDVLAISPHLHQRELLLRAGETILDQWIADARPRSWRGALPATGDADELDITVSTQDGDLRLFASTVSIVAYLRLLEKRSVRVTTVDGSLLAELAWIGAGNWDHKAVEVAFEKAGFRIVGWQGDVLSLCGTRETLGSQTVRVGDGTQTLTVSMLTLPSLDIELVPNGIYEAGQQATLTIAGESLDSALYEIQGGPLKISVERVQPYFDDLSSRTQADRIQFDNSGRYEVALVAAERRLKTISVVVSNPVNSVTDLAVTRVEETVSSTLDASVRSGNILSVASTAILVEKRAGNIQILQDAPQTIASDAFNFLTARIGEGTKVLVVWPGALMGGVAGELLALLRANSSATRAACLSYPAPRGDLVNDALEARRLRDNGVLCTLPKESLIEHDDGYPCPSCGDKHWLKTDDRLAWLECRTCGHVDRDLVVTLQGLRSQNVDMLFASFRMAKYLIRGRGSRYAGGFARSVRCTTCHRPQPMFSSPSPWDRGELRRLITALSESWDPNDHKQSIRKAARKVGARSGSRLLDVQRYEDRLRLLVDAGIWGPSENLPLVERLEAGASMCCGAELMWAKQNIGFVFLDIELLTSNSIPASAHVGLPKGPAGVRELLGLAD